MIPKYFLGSRVNLFQGGTTKGYSDNTSFTGQRQYMVYTFSKVLPVLLPGGVYAVEERLVGRATVKLGD